MNTPIFVAGPTAVGKSELALHLAKRLGGEIISVDSMQVYRGLEIGTAKPSMAERQAVPHHLIDVVDLDQPFDAAQFVRLARSACTQIQQRARIPILCGGTGLYFQAYLEGIGSAPPADPSVRAELEKSPTPELLQEIQRRDPALYERIDPHNRRRLIRALEVLRLTGRPFSEQRDAWTRGQTGLPAESGDFFVLTRDDLRARIDRRVDQMFELGLVEETKKLLERGLERNQTAMQAIGYRQVVEYLRGLRSLDDTIELVKVRTRQFAKRQLTWFRRQAGVRWISIAPGESMETTLERVLSLLSVHGVGMSHSTSAAPHADSKRPGDR